MGGRPFAVAWSWPPAWSPGRWSVTSRTSHRRRRSRPAPRRRRRWRPRRCAAFVRAVRAGDADAARALAPEGDTAAAERLAGIVANARAAHVRHFSLRYVDAEGGRRPRQLDAAADATWRFTGFDRAPAHAEVLVALQDDGDRVAITGFGGGDRVSPLWLSGPLEVRRTAADAGAGRRPVPRGRRLRAPGDHGACRSCARCCPGGTRGLVVEVPASLTALNHVLDADRGTYDQIAAVTTSADGQLTPDAPVHVFVNPDVFDGLKPTGAQVVMSHEATHVASGRVHQRDAAVAARGLRRLRRAARRAPARLAVGLPRSSRRYAATARPGTCRAPATSAPGRPASGRRTRAPGWPAACWPRTAARRRWSGSTATSTVARPSAAPCSPSSA